MSWRLTKALFYEEVDEEPVLVRTVDYRYDPFDRLVRRALETDGNGFYDNFEYLVYDGADPVLEFVDADGQSSGLPTLGRRYLNGPAVDQVLAEEDVNLEEALWHLDDHLGTTRDLVDAVGDVIEHYVFDSYGNLLAIEDENGTPISGDPSTHYLYTGLFHDPETGFYFALLRVYDPLTGRWMQEDLIWDGFNRQSYVGNSPTNYTDPTGLEESMYFPGAPDHQLPSDGSIGPEHLQQGDAIVTIHDDGTRSIIGRGPLNPDALLYMEDPAAYEQKKKEEEEQAERDRQLDMAQAGLGVVGLAPGAGDVVDIVDAGICGYRGDWAGVGISVGAALPVVGVVFGYWKNARKAKQLAKTPEAIGGVANTVDKARDAKKNVEAVNPRPKALKKVEEHHLQTNKNSISTAAGGPYTPKFEELARRRGTTLNDTMNKVQLPGHKGPHPEYNEAVYERMQAATQGLKGKEFNKAYDKALERIRKETLKPGSKLNRLATGKGC